MKSGLKKINRGVLLSLAVVLAIIAYYVVIEIRMGPDKKEIAELAKSFGEIYEDGNLRKEEYRKYVVYPEEQIKEDKATLEKSLEKIYVKDSEGIKKWVTELTDNNNFKTSSHQYFETFDVKFNKIYEVSVKNGKGTASADFTINQKVHQDPLSDSIWEHEENFTALMTLEKVDGKWLATAISSSSSFWR